jgi:hypothetical protein
MMLLTMQAEQIRTTNLQRNKVVLTSILNNEVLLN